MGCRGGGAVPRSLARAGTIAEFLLTPGRGASMRVESCEPRAGFRKQRRRRRGAVALVAALGWVVAATTASAATADPKQAVLRRADLPMWFATKSTRYVNNDTASREDPGAPNRDYAALGRVGGYEIQFTRNGGLLVVRSTASVYRSATAAREMLRRDADRIAYGNYGLPFDPWLVAPPPVGDDSRWYGADQGPPRPKIGRTLVLWTVGSLYLSVVTTGPNGSCRERRPGDHRDGRRATGSRQAGSRP